MTTDYERGMHSTWLVKDIGQFLKDLVPTSGNDKCLEYGLTLREWRAIFLDVLADNDDSTSKVFIAEHYDSVVERGPEPIPGFPMLSRITGLHWDVDFESEEVKPLREECVKLRQSTENPVARRGLEKLVVICDEASQRELAICMLCD
jgi:hypothetical protein